MNAITAPDRIWAKVRGAYQTLPGRSSYVIGSFEARPDDKATEYVRGDLAPAWNRDMSAAPKNKPILAWCDHDADSYEIGRTSDGRSKLTIYAAHAEGLGHAGTGYRVIEWGGGWNDCPEDGAGGLPDWWFVADSDFEVPANPIAWMPLPKHPDGGEDD